MRRSTRPSSRSAPCGARLFASRLHIFDDPNFTGNVPIFDRDSDLRLVGTSDPPAFRQYGVRNASGIWRPTNARLLIVVGSREEYDTVARMTLDRGARPGTLIPIWWQDTADRLPSELLERAQAVLLEEGRFGDRGVAERSLASYAANGGRVLLDAHGASSGLSELWPVDGATTRLSASGAHASSASLGASFAPAPTTMARGAADRHRIRTTHVSSSTRMGARSSPSE